MIHGVPSRSAEEVAVYRAAHQVLDVPRIFDDPLARRVISGKAQLALASRSAGPPVDPNVRAFIALRSRFAEDELASAVKAGVRQYVILGAGLDTFAYRSPYTALPVRVFEVDHPATQSWKRERLEKAGIAIPESLVFVPLDFRQQVLAEALRGAGFLAGQSAFFSMLGVAIFLPRSTLTEILALVASLPAAGGIVLDYGMLDASLSDGQRVVRERAARASASLGEPFVTFLDPDALATEARRMGFTGVDDFGFAEANARYFDHRADDLRVGSSGRRIVALRR
jgi:methyltransferase (TIGR00027 family)